MKLPLLNIDGSNQASIEISDKLLKQKVNHKLIKFVIDWQLNHAKPRIAKTKQRNEIKGSTKKIIAKEIMPKAMAHYSPKMRNNRGIVFYDYRS